MAENLKFFNGEEKEEIIVCKASNNADSKFDMTIGCIQDILLDDKFISLQNKFLEDHYHHFEDTEENKLIYMDIFKKYTELVEKHLGEALRSKISSFVMEKFLASLESRKNEVGEEIQDLLSSFSDFLAFKQMFLDYRAEKEGKFCDLGGLVVNSLSLKAR